MLRRPSLLLSIVLLTGCSTATPTATSEPLASLSSAPATAGASVPATTSLAAGLPACDDDPAWRCGTVDVPLDRTDPSSTTIAIHFYVLDRLDHSGPPAAPVFVTPGGPGASIWAQHAGVPIKSWDREHETVLIDPRGVGASDPLVCPALESWLANGMSPISAENDEVAACAASLGPNADRYGSAERARDVDAVRAELQVQTFDYYAGSAATIDAQAYAARFPEHLFALVLDSAFPATSDTPGWEVGYPGMVLRAIARDCARTAGCQTAFPDPVGLLTRLVRAVAKAPIRVPGFETATGPVVIDQAAVAGLLLSGDTGQTVPLLGAAKSALDGRDNAPLLHLVGASLPPADPVNPTQFSWGDNAAVACAGGSHPWSASTPIADRPAKLAASLAALPADAFAPFSHAGWEAANQGSIDQCLAWPVTDRVDPPTPPGQEFFPALQVLVIAGDLDVGSPVEYGKAVAARFPGAVYAVIGGAGHVAASPYYGPCAGELVDAFLDRLTIDPKMCAASDE